MKLFTVRVRTTIDMIYQVEADRDVDARDRAKFVAEGFEDPTVKLTEELQTGPEVVECMETLR